MSECRSPGINFLLSRPLSRLSLANLHFKGPVDGFFLSPSTTRSPVSDARYTRTQLGQEKDSRLSRVREGGKRNSAWSVETKSSFSLWYIYRRREKWRERRGARERLGSDGCGAIGRWACCCCCCAADRQPPDLASPDGALARALRTGRVPALFCARAVMPKVSWTYGARYRVGGGKRRWLEVIAGR